MPELTKAELDAIDDRIDDLVSYHDVDADQIEAMQNMRECARIFLRGLYKNVPSCADRSAAERELRSALTWSNLAISRKGRP